MSRLIKRWFMSMALIMTALFSNVISAEQSVESGQVIRHLSLTHHDFEDWTFIPQANDKVLITNQSDITHSIYVTYPDGTVVNLGVQLPGEIVTWVIPTAGDYVMQCWIHPIIKADMTVSP